MDYSVAADENVNGKWRWVFITADGVSKSSGYDFSTEADAKCAAEVYRTQAVTEGEHTGPILSIDDGIVIQDKGRGVSVRHALALLKGVMPTVNASCKIKYRDGVGVVAEEKVQSKDRGR